jgi:hypothetical protein
MAALMASRKPMTKNGFFDMLVRCRRGMELLNHPKAAVGRMYAKDMMIYIKLAYMFRKVG